MKKIFYCALILAIIYFLTIIICNGEKIKKEYYVEENIVSEIEKKEIIFEESKIISSNENKETILEVNGERITKKDIDFYNYQLNNKYKKSAESGNINAKEHIIAEVVISQESKKNGNCMSETEKEKLKHGIQQDIENSKEISNIFKENNHINKDEFIDYYLNIIERAYINLMWKQDILKKIDNGELVANETFNLEYNNYKKISNVVEKREKLDELLNIYINYIVDKSEIKEF